MCGFLLRTIVLGLFIFFLFDTAASIHIVTLGGQILGSAIIAIVAATLHTITRKIFAGKSTRIFSATFCTAFIGYLTMKLLPGYSFSGVAASIFVLLLISLAAAIVGIVIEDR